MFAYLLWRRIALDFGEWCSHNRYTYSRSWAQIILELSIVYFAKQSENMQVTGKMSRWGNLEHRLSLALSLWKRNDLGGNWILVYAELFYGRFLRNIIELAR